jgi:hypothetical protein
VKLAHGAVALLIFALALGTAGAASAAEPAPLEVVAELVDIPGKLPPDDLYDYAFAMKYRVTGGSLDKQEILVLHYKPRQARADITDKMKPFVKGPVKRFKKGDVHKLVLTPMSDKIFTGAVVDEYFAADRKSARYWCLEANPSS